MWKHTVHKPEAIERFKARRAEAGIGGVVCHALYLCNLAAPDDVIYEKSILTIRTTLEAACSIEADAVIFHVGSHLGAGFEAGLDRVTAALRSILEGYEGDSWLLIENSAGTGGTIGRSIEELATLVDALDGHPRLGICLDSCHLYASGYDVTDPVVVDALAGQVATDRARPAAGAPHQRQQDQPLGSNRDRHANILEGELGEGLGAFSRHPAFQELATYLEVEGQRLGPGRERAAQAARAPCPLEARRSPEQRRRPNRVEIGVTCADGGGVWTT